MRWNWMVFWGVAGIAMLVSSFWVNWFVVDLTLFKVNVGWFATVYASLLLIINVQLKKEIAMTPRELHDWGQTLSEVTPFIIEQAEAGKRPKQIAALLEAERKIPPIVSLKYMVALSKELKKKKEEGGPPPAA